MTTPINDDAWLDEILNELDIEGEMDADDTGFYRIAGKQKVKSAIQAHLQEAIVAAQLEILMGFRRRDFVREDMYEAAVIKRIAELQAELKWFTAVTALQRLQLFMIVSQYVSNIF